MLEVYEKCRKGLERAVHKLQEEKEKQEEERRSIRMKWGMRGSLPPASESGGEKIKDQPQLWEEGLPLNR